MADAKFTGEVTLSALLLWFRRDHIGSFLVPCETCPYVYQQNTFESGSETPIFVSGYLFSPGSRFQLTQGDRHISGTVHRSPARASCLTLADDDSQIAFTLGTGAWNYLTTGTIESRWPANLTEHRGGEIKHHLYVCQLHSL
jgi:hypothetical protein